MKKFTVLCMLIFAAYGVSAQTEGKTEQAGRKTTFERNGFWDNWFLGVGAGANVYFGGADKDADFLNRPTVTPIIQTGKWFNPYSGARLKLAGGTNLHTFYDNASVMGRARYFSAEVNYMFDIINYFGKYNPKRVYSLIPYAGVGYAYSWDYDNIPAGWPNNDHANSITFDAGLINRFKINKRLALDVEVSAKVLKENFDQRYGGDYQYDLMGTLSGTLVFNLGKTVDFKQAQAKDQSEINSLNNIINQQRQEIAALSNRPMPEPKVITKEVIKEVTVGQVPVNNVVLFSIGKSKIEKSQGVNVYNVAKYLKENSDKKVRVVGYTDKATGTPAINERLSKERAQNVADMLIKEFGISSDRVNIQWEGQSNPPFDVVEWNRAVILYVE